MPRIRTVKPEYFTHPEVVRLSLPARLLFISLWTQADDEGRLYDQPRKIDGLAFGSRDSVDTEGLIRELADAGKLLRYDGRGRRCLQVVNFHLHQAISHPHPSKIPPPPKVRKTAGQTAQPTLEDSRKGPGRLRPRTGNREQGTGNMIGASPNGASPGIRDEFFEAIVQVCQYDLAHLTATERGRVNRAAKELRAVGATPGLTLGFGQIWNEAHPDIVATPQTITGNWADYMAGNIRPLARRR